MNRIGIFGGSFDPVHHGHLLVAQAATEELELDRLVFVPAYQSPFKPDRHPAPGPQRLRMLRLALAGQTHFEVDDSELRRGGVSYTIDTARAYAARYPGASLFYLIGADHISQLPRWRESTELARMLQFVVIPRPGEEPASAPASFSLQQLRGFPIAVSSSQIRERVKLGLPIDHLTPVPVAEAIRNNQLYL